MKSKSNDKRLMSLILEHRDLDEIINRVFDEHIEDDIRMRRMKKRKLALKDQIAMLESRLLPNLIA
tara:strand:+ start:140 stop:337 length:198 start_codon:yes stop_codon:yes gene_type:complete